MKILRGPIRSVARKGPRREIITVVCFWRKCYSRGSDFSSISSCPVINDKTYNLLSAFKSKFRKLDYSSINVFPLLKINILSFLNRYKIIINRCNSLLQEYLYIFFAVKLKYYTLEYALYILPSRSFCLHILKTIDHK